MTVHDRSLLRETLLCRAVAQFELTGFSGFIKLAKSSNTGDSHNREELALIFVSL